MGQIEHFLHQCARMRAWLYTRLIAGQFSKFGSGSRVVPPFRFYGLSQMRLGDDVLIERNCWIHAVGVPGETDTAVKLVIGSHAGIGMGATISAARQVTIGEYVLLARNVYISDHAHAFEDPATPIMHQGVNKIMPVSIGRHTWLGQNVVVLPGATIGEHCVIGANSVVNSQISDFTLAVGTPARPVKRFDRQTGRWEKVEQVENAL